MKKRRLSRCADSEEDDTVGDPDYYCSSNESGSEPDSDESDIDLKVVNAKGKKNPVSSSVPQYKQSGSKASQGNTRKAVGVGPWSCTVAGSQKLWSQNCPGLSDDNAVPPLSQLFNTDIGSRSSKNEKKNQIYIVLIH